MKSDRTRVRSGDILHTGRLGRFAPSAAKYTSSIDIDHRILKAVIAINSAHAVMLSRKGLIHRETARKLLHSLSIIPRNMELKEVLEDVHMNVEDLVILSAGREVGGMLNLAKSRNDQVATALRMALRGELLELGCSLVSLQNALLLQAGKHAGTIMPGYTHLQRAQPVTVGHHLLAHFDVLDRDFSRLLECYRRVNQSPMGSGALASSSFSLDRRFVAKLLGFDSLVENSLDAVSSRDFAIESVYLCAQIMADLSRLSEEIVLWTTKEFSFAEISDRYSSTSSMMPQKKNAIVPEIGRAKASQVVGDLVGALGIVRSLPLSYNLDLQELTRNLWSALDNTISSLALHAQLLEEIKFNEEILLSATVSDDFLFATELADHLVTKYGLPFREAHGRVASLVKHASELSREKNQFKQFSNVTEAELEKILGVPIKREEISDITNPNIVLRKRKTIGAPNPTLVSKSCKARSKDLTKHGEMLRKLSASVTRSEMLLVTYVKSLGRQEESTGSRKRDFRFRKKSNQGLMKKKSMKEERKINGTEAVGGDSGDGVSRNNLASPLTLTMSSRAGRNNITGTRVRR